VSNFGERCPAVWGPDKWQILAPKSIFPRKFATCRQEAGLHCLVPVHRFSLETGELDGKLYVRFNQGSMTLDATEDTLYWLKIEGIVVEDSSSVSSEKRTTAV
jgi:hypothetical protein